MVFFKEKGRGFECLTDDSTILSWSKKSGGFGGCPSTLRKKIKMSSPVYYCEEVFRLQSFCWQDRSLYFAKFETHFSIYFLACSAGCNAWKVNPARHINSSMILYLFLANCLLRSCPYWKFTILGPSPSPRSCLLRCHCFKT